MDSVLVQLRSIDVVISQFVAEELRTDWMTSAFYFITTLGNFEVLAVIVSLVASYLLYQRRYLQALWLGVVTSGAGLTTHYLKLVFLRERPEFRLLEEATYSFPSGHATGAAVVGGAIGWLVYKYTKVEVQKRVALSVAVVFIVLVSASRVYLGVHYLSDIIAGWLVAAIWIVGSVLLLRRFYQGRNTSNFTNTFS